MFTHQKSYNWNSIKIQNLFVVGLIELDYSFIVKKKKKKIFGNSLMPLTYFLRDTSIHINTGFSVRLRISYLIETENFFAESIVNKSKN